METTRFSRLELAFMLAVPLGWGTLLLFHPNPTQDIHAGLHHEVTRWLMVHLGTLVGIGLIGAVLRLLTRGPAGTARRRSARRAVIPFILFYGAGEAIRAPPPVSLSGTPTVSPAERRPPPVRFKPCGMSWPST